MTDNTSPEGSTPPTPGLRMLASPADLDSVDFEAPIRGLDVCDSHEFSLAYEQAFIAAREIADEPAQIVFRLFYNLCSMILRPSDPASAWGPLFTTTTGSSATVEHFRGEQTATLAAVVGRIVDPRLRARVADIVWTNNRRDGASAASAVEAYCEAVNGLLEGRLKASHGGTATAGASSLAHRALQIADVTTKWSKRPKKLLDTIDLLYRAARDRGDVSTFVRVAELTLSYKLQEPGTVAPALEAVASGVPAGSYPMVAKSAWDLAAQLYHKLNDKDARRRCMIGALDQILAMRSEVKGSAAAEASWIMDALQQLRHIDGMEDREQELEMELRRLQKASLKQMARFEVDLAIGDIPEKIAEHFANLSLSDALKQFALVDHSRDPDRLRADALATLQSSPLTAMLSMKHVDDEGRTGSQSAGAPSDGQPEDTWFRRVIGESERFHRARTVGAAIDPARIVIHARFGIAMRHFDAIVGLSGFVPDEQKHILSLGFVRFFQGDFISATHLTHSSGGGCPPALVKNKRA